LKPVAKKKQQQQLKQFLYLTVLQAGRHRDKLKECLSTKAWDCINLYLNQ
jgi:hypothetical protein